MIYASNFILTGSFSNIPVYTNNLTAPEFSNISLQGDVNVNGSVFTNGRMDVGKTIYATFRLNSNLSFDNTNEIHGLSNRYNFDFTSSDMSGMSNMQLAVPPFMIYNSNNGRVTVPISGLYALEMQGVFQNDPAHSNVQNGVYYKFLNHSYSNARMAASITNGSLVSTSHMAFLLAGDVFCPTFFSNDSNAQLVSTNGETYVTFSVAATVTPTHSNYVRVPV